MDIFRFWIFLLSSSSFYKSFDLQQILNDEQFVHPKEIEYIDHAGVYNMNIDVLLEWKQICCSNGNKCAARMETMADMVNNNILMKQYQTQILNAARMEPEIIHSGDTFIQFCRSK